MEQCLKCGFVVLAIVFISLNVNGQPLAPNAGNEQSSDLPPLIFPKDNVTLGTGLPPTIFPTGKENVTIGTGLPPTIFPTGKENVTIGTGLPPAIFPTGNENVIIGTGLPPIIFPTENVNLTIGTGLPPTIFPTENITIGDAPTSVNGTDTTTVPKEKSANIPPLIFPTSNGSIPLIELPPLIFPDDSKAAINKTALEILNAVGNTKHDDMHILPKESINDDYYKEDSSESSDTDEVEEVQAIDKKAQKDNLEENYKSKMNLSPLSPINEFDDDTEVDHPMLKNTHILGIVGAVLAVLCVCLYLGITVWRRAMFNRYGMRERLINEDDFYSDKSIRHDF